MSAWVYIECDVCGEHVPVATEHETPCEALEVHKRAHPNHAHDGEGG